MIYFLISLSGRTSGITWCEGVWRRLGESNTVPVGNSRL